MKEMAFYAAYEYVTKQDTDVYLSPGHPNLDDIGSPMTITCVRAYRESSNRKRAQQDTSVQNQTNKINKIRRLSNIEVSEFLIKNNIKRQTELNAVANAQSKEGKKDLANFVLSRSTKSLQELMENTWKMESAQAQLTRQKQLRIDIIRKTAVTTCVDGCNGHWYECTTEVLQMNSIHPFVFAAALRELMIKGRGKFRNLMLVDPANCGKLSYSVPCKCYSTHLAIHLMINMLELEQNNLK